MLIYLTKSKYDKNIYLYKVTVILLQLGPSLDMTSFNVVAVWCKFKFTNFNLVDRYLLMHWYKLDLLSESVQEMIINTLE